MISIRFLLARAPDEPPLTDGLTRSPELTAVPALTP